MRDADDWLAGGADRNFGAPQDLDLVLTCAPHFAPIYCDRLEPMRPKLPHAFEPSF